MTRPGKKHQKNAAAFDQALTRYLSPEQLNRIRAVRVAIGGAGGLGSNVAGLLIRTGFRRLDIIDCDLVDISNLNRQDYTLADVGRPKTEALATRLRTINPGAAIRARTMVWVPPAAGRTTRPASFAQADIVVEAFDHAAMKAAFVEYYAARVPWVISGNGMAGISGAPIGERRAGNIILIGDGTTSIDDGHPPLAPRVMECAARMAAAALRLALAPRKMPAPPSA